MKTYTAEDVFKMIQDRFEDMTIPLAVERALKPFEGKRITKRLGTAVEKELPGYTVAYNAEYISVWGNGIDFDNRIMLFISLPDYRNPEGVFKMDWFKNDKNIAYYGAAIERNQARKALLETPGKVQEITDKINACNKAYKEVMDVIGYPMPDQYFLEDLLNCGRKK